MGWFISILYIIEPSINSHIFTARQVSLKTGAQVKTFHLSHSNNITTNGNILFKINAPKKYESAIAFN